MATTELDTMTIERHDGVVTMTLRRPERKNAIDGRMWVATLVKAGTAQAVMLAKLAITTAAVTTGGITQVTVAKSRLSIQNIIES